MYLLHPKQQPLSTLAQVVTSQLPLPFPPLFTDRTRYTTRTRVENGVRYREEVTMPRHRSSWRRRYGASYYPPRYYARPPRARYVGGTVTCPARYPPNVGYPRAVSSTAMVPRGGYVAGGRAVMPSAYNMVSLRSFLLFIVALHARLSISHRHFTCVGSSCTSTTIKRCDSF